MLVLDLMDMGNALWQTSTIRWRNSNLHEPKKHLKLHQFALSLSHHASSRKPTKRSKKKRHQLINWDLPQDQLFPLLDVIGFFSRFLSQQFPSLKLTTKAPENGGLLQKIRCLLETTIFRGRLLLLVSGEVITLDSSLPQFPWHQDVGMRYLLCHRIDLGTKRWCKEQVMEDSKCWVDNSKQNMTLAKPTVFQDVSSIRNGDFPASNVSFLESRRIDIHDLVRGLVFKPAQSSKPYQTNLNWIANQIAEIG